MLSVVVPTFNEGKNIRNLVTQIKELIMRFFLWMTVKMIHHR